MSDVRASDEPHDRLTTLCAAMTNAMVAHPLHSGEVKCIVFLQDGERGGMQIHGYGSEGDDQADVTREAAVDLFIHMKAMFKASGMDLHFAPIVGHG